MDCFGFSDPCLRVLLSTSKRSKVLSTPQVSVKKILSNFLEVNYINFKTKWWVVLTHENTPTGN